MGATLAWHGQVVASLISNISIHGRQKGRSGPFRLNAACLTANQAWSRLLQGFRERVPYPAAEALCLDPVMLGWGADSKEQREWGLIPAAAPCPQSRPRGPPNPGRVALPCLRSSVNQIYSQWVQGRGWPDPSLLLGICPQGGGVASAWRAETGVLRAGSWR